MALSIPRLAGNIEAIMDDYDNLNYVDKAAARADFSTKLATAIINEVKLMTITYTAGLTAGATGVTGVFNNSIT